MRTLRLLLLALACCCTQRRALAQAPDDSAHGSSSPSVFFRDEARGFADSATVVAERNATRQRCGDGGNVTRLYAGLERVLVFHWAGLTLNGLGNTFGYYQQILSAAALHERAAFSARNVPGCGGAPPARPCRMNPAVYLGGRGGFSWDWNAATEGAVRSAMSARGRAETPFVLDSSSVAIVNNVTGERLSGGKHTLASFLAHPGVAQLPWVSLHLPPEPALFTVNALWEAEEKGSRPGNVWDFLVGGRPAAESWRNLTASRGVTDAFCLCACFVDATPRLQRALRPHLARLDATRAAGGGVAGVHVRSGYADFAVIGGALDANDATTHGQQQLSNNNTQEAAPSASPHSHFWWWGYLDALSQSCPANASVAAKYGVAAPHACTAWDNATAEVFASRGAACAAQPAERPPPLLPATYAFGDEGGTYSTLAACAVHAARGAGRGSSGGVGNNNNNATHGNNATTQELPFLLYVAGDLPPLVQLLSRHPVLRAHAVSGEGALGHVSADVLCATTARSRHAKVCSDHGWDPGGAWTRAMVDAWMLGAVDVLVRYGATSFVNMVRARVAWPLPERLLRGELQPAGNWTRIAAYTRALHAAVEAMTRELGSGSEQEQEEVLG